MTSLDSPELQGVALALRVGVGTLLLFAGATKLVDRRGFLEALRGYGFLPAALNRIVSWVVPTVEIGVGGGLLLGVRTREVALAAAGLLLAFTAWVIIALIRGRVIDCGCFSRSVPKALSRRLVARNVVLSGAALFVAFSVPVLSIDQHVLRTSESYSYADLLPGVILVTVGLGMAAIALSLTSVLKMRKP